MKSKNKFINNLRNKKYINIIIITLIIGFSIYILYFNDKIHIQDAVVNSLNESETYLVENFDVAKYVDVCKNRSTHFYNLSPTISNAPTIDACEKVCSDDISCNIFTFKNNTCSTYKGVLNSSNIDTRNHITDPINISCSSKIFPNNTSYNYGTHNGIGYIKKNYYINNKDKLKYIDPYLTESVKVLGSLYSIDNSRNILRNNPSNASTIRDNVRDETKNLFTKFNDLNRDIFDIDSDNSRNVLYTDMFRSTPEISSSILAPVPRDISFIIALDNSFNIANKLDNLQGVIDADSIKFISNNLHYLILAFIMVITIIILILYKSSNLINEKILIIYIIIITFLVLFLTHYLKL